MRNGLVTKGLVLGIIMLFLGTSMLPSINADLEIRRTSDVNQDDKTSSVSSTLVDWWPMICHDSAHSGYSTSTIPDEVMIQWKNKTLGFIESSPSIVDDKLFITTADFYNFAGYIFCFDINLGRCLWFYKIRQDQFFSSAAVLNERVYACTLNGKLICLNISTGEKIWNVTLDSHIIIEDSSPVIVDGRIYICCRCDDYSYNGKIFCINADEGSIIWQKNSENNRDFSPALLNGRIYTAGINNELSCYDAENGNLLWTCPDIRLSTHPSLWNHSVFVGTEDGRICRIENGSIIWQYQTSSDYLITIPPIIAYGRIYAGAYSPKNSLPDIILCFNADTGDMQWSNILEDQGGVGYIPAVADDKLLVLSSFFCDPSNCDRIVKVYCFNSTSGSSIWSYILGEGKDNYAYNSPSIVENKIFVCTTETINNQVWGGVYCLSGNHPPNPPTITGPSSGKAGTQYPYNVTAIDPDGDQIQYTIDWGDNTTNTSEFVDSGVSVTMMKTWTKTASLIIPIPKTKTFTVKVKAIDMFGAESDWTNLTVTMPYTIKSPLQQFFEWLFHRFPHTFPILRHLIGY